jgi:tyrosyl-tRNA synthetase
MINRYAHSLVCFFCSLSLPLVFVVLACLLSCDPGSAVVGKTVAATAPKKDGTQTNTKANTKANAKANAKAPTSAPAAAPATTTPTAPATTAPATTAPATTAPAAAAVWTEDLQADYDRIFSVGEECISGPELKALLLRKGRGATTVAATATNTKANANTKTKTGFYLYDGFEPSGRMHIAQGVFKAMNVNKCTGDPGTGATFVFWVADWFALMNDKMGGDLDKIKTVGDYLIEVWKAAGMNLTNVVFKWASEEITQQAATYWPTMLDVARRFNVTRIKKCCQIMGRLEGSLTAAQVLYPLMQCTDVFFLKADICQLGVDQRKVNMLAREYCDAAGIKHKPIILSHHMLYGLKAGQEKMSKSDPDSAVFMEDAAVDVERKIRNAYCPRQEVVGAAAATTTTTTTTNTGATSGSEDAGKESMHLVEDTLKNPCLDYVQHIIFSPPDATFTAGSQSYTNFQAVREAFLQGSLSEDDLKSGLIQALNALLEPVRKHFSENERAKNLLELVRQYKKEAAPPQTVVRRLNLVALGTVPAGAHLVFAPLPVTEPTLQQAMDVLAQLRLAAGGQPGVLYLPDWAARVCNAVGADVKAITAYYTILVTSLKALDAKLMANVQVVMQSEAILADPSNYWISVINAGRHFMLDDVMGSGMKDSDGVGLVIGRLMKVADVAGVEPASLALPAGLESSTIESKLIADFFPAKLAGVTMPTVTTTASESVRLQVVRESEALKTPNDEYFLLDDPKVSVVCCGVLWCLVSWWKQHIPVIPRDDRHNSATALVCST